MKNRAWIAALSGFQYGYNTSIIAAALLFLKEVFLLTSFQEGMVVGITMIGLCGASFSPLLSNYWGRKPVLFCGALLFLAGCLFSACARDYESLLLGRLLIGIGSGTAIVSPLYLVEMASVERRGRILNCNQIGIAGGSLLAYLAGYFFSFSGNWRWMFAIGIVPALIQLTGLPFLPETLPDKTFSYSWKKVVARSYLPRFKIVLFLSFFQAFSGVNAIFFFAPVVFENVGFVGIQQSLLSTVFIGIAYLSAILLSFWAVDHLGRRFLLLGSFLGMALLLFTLSLFSFSSSPWLDTAAIVCILGYVACYALGAGPIPPLIIGEMSPLEVRGHSLTIMGVLGWLSNYAIALTFLPSLNLLRTTGTFLVYGLFCLFAFILFYYKIPETKQKSLSEIENLFH